MTDLDRLRAIRARLMNAPQSAERETEVARLEWEMAKMEAERVIRRARLAHFLFGSFLKNGSMEIVLLDGRRISGNPERHADPIQDVWNIRDKAEALAGMQVEDEDCRI